MLPPSLLLHQLPVTLLLSLIASVEVSALATPLVPGLDHVPPPRNRLLRRSKSELSAIEIALPLKRRNTGKLHYRDEVEAWARRQGDRLLARYNPSALVQRDEAFGVERRAQGLNYLTNQVWYPLYVDRYPGLRTLTRSFPN